jgi:outer membrane protein assembly factor BamD (BamD/ComL family)
MADMQADVDVQSGLSTGRLVSAAMGFVAFLLGAVATVWAIARVWQMSQIADPAQQPSFADFLAILGFLLAAWAVSLLVWGAAEALRRLEDLVESVRGGGALGSATPSRAMDAGLAEAQMGKLTQLLQVANEVRDISLLGDTERAARAQAESTALARQLEHEVPELLQAHNWKEAQIRVQRARARFPAVSAWDALAAQVEQARAKFEAHDIQGAEREINDLVALNAWDRAAGIVRDLKRRHPDSQRVKQLAERVQGELNKAAAAERGKLMAQAQEATNDRQWAEALRLVEKLLEKFPNSVEAHDLRLQLPTLRTNVEIQQRQQMEAEIRDLIKQGRFAPALQLARELISRYPDSPQAEVLREQLPKLESKVRAL